MQLPPVDRSTSWRPQGADLYSTGASGAVPQRPICPAVPDDSQRPLGEGALDKTREKPSNPDQANRDWTEGTEKKNLKTLPEPPKEPQLYKVMIEFIQSMWRASGSAIEMAQNVNQTTLAERLAQQAKNEPLTYSDPTVKRTTGL